METLGSRLKYLRESIGVTPMEVSVGTKIAARALRYYETDDRNPGSDAVIKLCRYFNISADWLLGLSDDRTIRNPVALSQQDDNNEVKP